MLGPCQLSRSMHVSIRTSLVPRHLRTLRLTPIIFVPPTSSSPSPH
jgi:hypothetical protein